MISCLPVFAQEVAAEITQKVIHAGKLIDTERGKVLEKQSIIIEGKQIVDVKPGYVSGDNIIDLKDSVVMPGLMDMHTHLMTDVTPESYTEEFFHDESYFAIN